MASSSTVSSTPIATETLNVPTPTPTPSPATSHSLSTGAIVGIALGGAAILLIAAIALWICGRRSNRSNNRDTSGAWYLGSSKKNGFESGATTPAMVPPAYNPHGMPVMTQAKGYPHAMPTTSVTEHYNFSPGPSPPPQNSPRYDQHAFHQQHRPMDAAAYGQNYGYPVAVGPGSPGYAPPGCDAAQYRPEIYSGTPPPNMQRSTVTSGGVRNSGVPASSVERTSMSLSGGNTNSRMGSPDHLDLAEMNAARSQAGTLNQGGGGFLLQPAPVRANALQSESHVDRFDA